MHRLSAHLRSNVVGWIALFVALGGTGYAAIGLPRNSVGAAQIRNRSITPVKLNPSSIGGSVRAWAIIRANATVLASSSKPVVFSSVIPGSYIVQWPARLPRTCATVGSVDARSPDQTPITLPNGGAASAAIGFVSNAVTQTVPAGAGRKLSQTRLDTFNQSGVPTPMDFDVAVVC